MVRCSSDDPISSRHCQAKEPMTRMTMMTKALPAWTASDSASWLALVSPVRLDMRISLVAIAVAFLVAAALADDQATSLAEARTAVEANLKTRDGKTYDEKLGKEFMEKHWSTMKQCAQRAENDLQSFWILMKLDKDGAVKEVLLHPATKMGACARETLLKSTFAAPPRAAYWVSVYMKLTH